jgi:hypothetical protein
MAVKDAQKTVKNGSFLDRKRQKTDHLFLFSNSKIEIRNSPFPTLALPVLPGLLAFVTVQPRNAVDLAGR